MIRNATIADKPHLLKLWQEGYGNTPFANLEYNDTHVQRLFAVTCTFDKKFFCKVVERDGEVVGVFIGVIDVNFWGIPMGQGLISYSRHETDKLLRQFTRWCKERGAKQVTVMTVPGNDKYLKIVEALGFKEVGRTYMKEV